MDLNSCTSILSDYHQKQCSSIRIKKHCVVTHDFLNCSNNIIHDSSSGLLVLFHSVWSPLRFRRTQIKKTLYVHRMGRRCRLTKILRLLNAFKTKQSKPIQVEGKEEKITITTSNTRPDDSWKMVTLYLNFAISYFGADVWLMHTGHPNSFVKTNPFSFYCIRIVLTLANALSKTRKLI